MGTLDTKGAEYAWLRERLRALGCEVVLVDTGIESSGVEADVAAERVAEAGGASLGALRDAGDR
ncbi:Tm-1-like ATP-binding domain-containing protein, partial [Actinomadura sp. 6K520]|uniref:Tm-1-like ATP-binding domain-containing protein n=1 Tax=Actinomadura sp. 6K520 TaxID=2530364 RepID=UPI001FB82E18